mmetsp:Transcript_13580/g.27794  ORF Transcript_13580/g.27794 Transcript_13580/m.27794 type:complete len:159 (+) Transcript_13580:81-557(+)
MRGGKRKEWKEEERMSEVDERFFRGPAWEWLNHGVDFDSWDWSGLARKSVAMCVSMEPSPLWGTSGDGAGPRRSMLFTPHHQDERFVYGSVFCRMEGALSCPLMCASADGPCEHLRGLEIPQSKFNQFVMSRGESERDREYTNEERVQCEAYENGGRV